MIVSMVLLYLAFFLPALAVWSVLWHFTGRLSPVPRVALLVWSAALLLTPSWASGILVAVPVPFGYLVGSAMITGAWSDVVAVLQQFSTWHLVAFPATATVFYVIVRLRVPQAPSGRSEGDTGGSVQSNGPAARRPNIDG